jgi:uncharacterized membrane protein
MSTILAILYPKERVADQVLESVEKLVRDGHLELEDACAVIRDPKGKVVLHQEHDLSVFGAIGGFALGTFFGWFIWMPYLGIPGAILGAMAGKVSDRGIDDQYMKDLGQEMQPGSSALFLLLRNCSVEKALEELAPHGGQVFHTSLAQAEEAELAEKMRSLQGKKASAEEFETPEPPTNDHHPEFLDY